VSLEVKKRQKMLEKEINQESKSVATFAFDGLVIEVLHLAKANLGENTNKSTSSATSTENCRIVCKICFNIIPSDDEIKIVECGDIFCRDCLFNYTIENHDTLMKCPSLTCQNQTSMENIKKLLGLEMLPAVESSLPSEKHSGNIFPKDSTR
jgi:late competence protein required for DNA uptake (superfamily II DNA/RNA helicase)